MPDEGLQEALQRLQISVSGKSVEGFIDDNLDAVRPRKRARPSLDALKAEIEAEFLTPRTSFGPEWFNKLQHRWESPPDYASLFQMTPTQTRTVTRFRREGLEGRVTGYYEVTVPADSATAKNSTSLLRKPANRADFVRGAAGFFPFAPGGLDGIQAVADLEDEASRTQTSQVNGARTDGLSRVIELGNSDGLLEIPPGFTRGLDFSKARAGIDEVAVKQVEEALEAEPEDADSEHEGGVPVDEEMAVTDAQDGAESEGPDEEDDIDALLPVEFPALLPHAPLASSSARRGGKEWAHMMDVNRGMPNFRELVPDMAREWPFELDTFQKEAIYHLENGDSVFVAAHTSAGKTVVAEYAIALAAKHMTKAIYTSPIKALSNQKFRDFRHTFDDVGILTGDVQIRPEASCLIMTTEILRSMLYRGADIIRDVEYVVFDEVHYVNDLERGVVWEEVIIMLPEQVTLILLSATVPNTYEFASWVGRTKKKNIYVISTPKRPVPLEHYLWAKKGMHKIVNAEKKFIDQGWKEANDVISGRDKAKASQDANGQAQRGGGNGRGRAGATPGNQRGGGPQRVGNQQHGGSQRGGPQNRGRGGPQQGRGNIARTGRGTGRTTAAQDRNLWMTLVQHLRKEDLLPACIFVFSKRRCEENADSLSNQDFCTASEKSLIHMTVERSVARLRPEERVLPQIRRLREMLSRGIAVHHGGLLPIVKEIVEILFSKTLVKVLFATETFAMGLNLPTRTVVFSGFRKHDGRSFRDLLPGEYTQMAGRAGRRGIDPVGSVIIVAPGLDEAPPVATLRQMILGVPTKLRSQFRLTYNMILNLLRVEALKIEEMIKRSFSENATQALLPEHEKQVKVSEADLLKIKREPCDICDTDLEQCHDAAMAYQNATLDIHMSLLGSAVGRRLLSPRRVVVFRLNGIRMPGVLVADGTSKGPTPTVDVLTTGAIVSTRQSNDLLPFVPKLRKFLTPFPKSKAQASVRMLKVPLADLDCITNSMMRNKTRLSLKEGEEETPSPSDNLLRQSIKLPTNNAWDEINWMARLKEVQIQEKLNARKQDLTIINRSRCLECPNFVKHFAMCHDEWLIKENIVQLRQLMSDQNLQLLPDYEQRIAVLTDLGFIDEGSRVELKGKVACEVRVLNVYAELNLQLQIHSADELVLTEVILENVLADLEPEEVVALLSAFVFQEKTDVEPTLTPTLEGGRDDIIRISEKVNAYQVKHQVILSSNDSNDFVSRPRFGLVEVVYEWARGMSFNRIMDLTDVLEGTIVRVITRLDETCREVKNAARIIGDPKLFTKMQTAQEMIKRDITAVASLYM